MEREIRKAIIEADLVDCTVALPGRASLFAADPCLSLVHRTTQNPLPHAGLTFTHILERKSLRCRRVVWALHPSRSRLVLAPLSLMSWRTRWSLRPNTQAGPAQALLRLWPGPVRPGRRSVGHRPDRRDLPAADSVQPLVDETLPLWPGRMAMAVDDLFGSCSR